MINLDLFLKTVDTKNGIVIYKETSCDSNCWGKHSLKKQESKTLEVVYAEVDENGVYEIYVRDNKEENPSEKITVYDFMSIQEHNECIVLYFKEDGEIKSSGEEYYNFLSYEKEVHLSDYNDEEVEKITINKEEIILIIKID